MISEKTKLRFLKYVLKKNNCWEWIGSTHPNGYGQFHFDGKPWKAHRFSWKLHYGEIPKCYGVLHMCDNTLCVNPEHLFLGTQKQNMCDCRDKGRMKIYRGSENVWHKLTEEIVKDILNTPHHKHRKTILAKKYGVSRRTICSIYEGTSWKHVSGSLRASNGELLKYEIL